MTVAARHQPLLPLKPADPTGADYLERQAMAALRERVRQCVKSFVEIIDRIPSEPAPEVSPNVVTINQRYVYLLDSYALARYLSDASDAIDQILLEGGRESVWFFEAHVYEAYIRGARQEYTNLARQSQAYKAGTGRFRDLLNSAPYRRRIALVASRQFEEMQNLGANIKADMSRILTNGIGRGMNPLDVAKQLTDATGMEIGRANRIARTEITTALRRARWDEHDDAMERYGVQTMLMHYSALSRTTRISHAERHGNLYTSEEVRDWYSEGANSINCKCTQISVMVDENGDPLAPSIIERARETERRMKQSGRGPWADEEAA